MTTNIIEQIAASYEADQANRDFMSEWINGTESLTSPYVGALRHYRHAAETVVDDMITAQIASIKICNLYDVGAQSTEIATFLRRLGE